MTFKEKLAALLNEFGWDTKTNTPDYVLAEQIEADLQSKVVEPEPEPTPDDTIPVGTPPKQDGP